MRWELNKVNSSIDLTFFSQARINMSNRKERKKAGKAARIAKLISLALRIWSSSSIALLEEGSQTNNEMS